MKKRIGLPRALMFYNNNILWKTFFLTLGCKITVSPETNKNIIENGIKNTSKDHCLAYQIYIGHLIYLNNFCDYILISSACNYGKNNKICPIINGTYDYVKYIIPKEKILEYNVDFTNHKYELFGFIKIGLKITKNPIKIIYGYIKGKIKQKKYNKEKEQEVANKLTQKNKKILLFSQIYNNNDKYITNYIKEYLKSQDIILIIPNYLNKKTALTFSEFISESIKWNNNKVIIGALYYYNYQIDGVIYLSTSNCNIDALINEVVRKKNNHLPSINIIINGSYKKEEIKYNLEKLIKEIKGEKNVK